MKGGESGMEQVELLMQILAETRQQNAMLQSAIETLREQSRQKNEEIERLRQIILNLQYAQFGQRSEKRMYVLDDGNQQLNLFDMPEKPQDTPAPKSSQNPEKETRVAGQSWKKKFTQEGLCASLPVEERIVNLPDDEKVNANGHVRTCIGQEYIRTELVLERARAKVVRYYRKVYADRELEQGNGYSRFQACHAAASAGTQLCIHLRHHRCVDEEICGRHVSVPAGADVETHGCGAEALNHGQLGHSGGGSLSSPLLGADSERAADPEHDTSR